MTRQRLLTLLALLAAVALIAAACGDDETTTAGAGDDSTTTDGDDDDGDTSDGDDGDTSDGDGDGSDDGDANGGAVPGEIIGSWTYSGGTVDGTALDPLPGWDVTLSVDEGGQVGGTAACNGYGGQATIGDGTFTATEYSITEMGCEQPVMALESAYMAALFRVDRFTVDGGALTLLGDGVELNFGETPTAPTAQLVGTTWTLDTLIDGETASSVISLGQPPMLTLDEDGTFLATTGCRIVTGTWLVANERLQFPNMSADGQCSPDESTQDGFIIAALEGPSTIEIDGPTLTLMAPGEVGLRYRSDLG